jgi:hypothetical protein
MVDGPRLGEQPLPQTVAAAAAMRRLTGLLVSLEQAHPTVDAMLAQFVEWEADLSAVVPPDPAPRIGPDPDGVRRVYLQHAFDVGEFNPSVPEYRFDRMEGESATGRITFPVVYEGPPGFVHGGFLGVFVDCVVQHHNLATGSSGMTRTMTVTYRRPVPLLTELSFDIVRTEAGEGVTMANSTVRLRLDDDVLCIGEVTARPIPSDRHVGYEFGPRRDGTVASS